jgi:hypothetical protein
MAWFFMIFTPKSYSSMEVTVGLKYKLVTFQFYLLRLNFLGRHQLISDGQAEHGHQFLTHKLSARISSLRAYSACVEGTFSNLEFSCLCLAYA